MLDLDEAFYDTKFSSCEYLLENVDRLNEDNQFIREIELQQQQVNEAIQDIVTTNYKIFHQSLEKVANIHERFDPTQLNIDLVLDQVLQSQKVVRKKKSSFEDQLLNDYILVLVHELIQLHQAPARIQKLLNDVSTTGTQNSHENILAAAKDLGKSLAEFQPPKGLPSKNLDSSILTSFMNDDKTLDVRDRLVEIQSLVEDRLVQELQSMVYHTQERQTTESENLHEILQAIEKLDRRKVTVVDAMTDQIETQLEHVFLTIVHTIPSSRGVESSDLPASDFDSYLGRTMESGLSCLLERLLRSYEDILERVRAVEDFSPNSNSGLRDAVETQMLEHLKQKCRTWYSHNPERLDQDDVCTTSPAKPPALFCFSPLKLKSNDSAKNTDRSNVHFLLQSNCGPWVLPEHFRHFHQRPFCQSLGLDLVQKFFLPVLPQVLSSFLIQYTPSSGYTSDHHVKNAKVVLRVIEKLNEWKQQLMFFDSDLQCMSQTLVTQFMSSCITRVHVMTQTKLCAKYVAQMQLDEDSKEDSKLLIFDWLLHDDDESISHALIWNTEHVIELVSMSASMRQLGKKFDDHEKTLERIQTLERACLQMVQLELYFHLGHYCLLNQDHPEDMFQYIQTIGYVYLTLDRTFPHEHTVIFQSYATTIPHLCCQWLQHYFKKRPTPGAHWFKNAIELVHHYFIRLGIRFPHDAFSRVYEYYDLLDLSETELEQSFRRHARRYSKLLWKTQWHIVTPHRAPTEPFLAKFDQLRLDYL